MKFIKEFELRWYIFSDGESAAKKSVKNAVKIMTTEAYETLANVIVIENGFDYEKMLIKNGNSSEIIAAINDINGNDNYYTSYIEKLNGDVKPKRRKTDKPPCTLCGQDIYEDYIEEIEGLEEDEMKLYRCMISSDGKAKYATTVAQYIVKSQETEKRFPPEILKLLLQIEKDFGLQRRSEYNGIELVGETERDC